MPPTATAVTHHGADDQAAEPGRRARSACARVSAGALQLRHEVEPADQDDEQPAAAARTADDRSRISREVGQRVRARSAQRRGDEREQDQVAGGVADRVPEHVERRRRARARRCRGTTRPTGTPRRSRPRSSAASPRGPRRRSRRSVRARRSPSAPAAIVATATTATAVTARRRSPSIRPRRRGGSPPPDQFGERALVAFGLRTACRPARSAPGRRERPARSHGTGRPEQPHTTRTAATNAAEQRDAAEQRGTPAQTSRPAGAGCAAASPCRSRRCRSARRSRAPPAGAAPRRAASVRGWVIRTRARSMAVDRQVELASASGRWSRVTVGRAGRAKPAVPPAHRRARCADADGVAAVDQAHLVDVGERRPACCGGCARSRPRPSAPRARQRAYGRGGCSLGGVQARVVALRLDVAHLRAAHEPGDAGQLDRDRLVVARGSLADPADTTRRTASASRSARTGFIT